MNESIDWLHHADVANDYICELFEMIRDYENCSDEEARAITVKCFDIAIDDWREAKQRKQKSWELLRTECQQR